MAKKTFLRGALILGVAGVIIKLLGAFFRIPLANMIGEEGMGYYMTAYPIYVLLLTLSTAGIPTAISKIVSEKKH
jgi:stage V sporulation protein B